MRLLLKSFSQDVDFLNPEQETNYLVFLDEESGRTLRVPVPKETILELVQMVQPSEPEAQEALEPAPPVFEDPDAGAEVFGETEEEEEEAEEEEEFLDEVPESEDKVPSL